VDLLHCCIKVVTVVVSNLGKKRDGSKNDVVVVDAVGLVVADCHERALGAIGAVPSPVADRVRIAVFGKKLVMRFGPRFSPPAMVLGAFAGGIDIDVY